MGIDLARPALAHLSAHKEQFNPCVWITDRQTDLAGRVVLNAGAEPLEYKSNQGKLSWVEYEGRQRTICALATELLGITSAEAAVLFDPHNSLRDCHTIVCTLELDRLITDRHGVPRVTCEETWRTRGSVPVIWRHRRTTVLLHDGTHQVQHHPSREAASDYATDVAACRILNYTHESSIWEGQE